MVNVHGELLDQSTSFTDAIATALRVAPMVFTKDNAFTLPASADVTHADYKMKGFCEKRSNPWDRNSTKPAWLAKMG